MQLEAADQTTLMSLATHDDGVPLDELSLPAQPVTMPLTDATGRQLAHAYRLIRHKYTTGGHTSSLQAIQALQGSLSHPEISQKPAGCPSTDGHLAMRKPVMSIFARMPVCKNVQECLLQ